MWIKNSTGALINLDHVALIEFAPASATTLLLKTSLESDKAIQVTFKTNADAMQFIESVWRVVNGIRADL